MAAPGLRAGVADVLAALVVDLDDLGLQCGKALPDQRGGVRLDDAAGRADSRGAVSLEGSP